MGARAREANLPPDPNLLQLIAPPGTNCDQFADAAGPHPNLSQLFSSAGHNCNTFG